LLSQQDRWDRTPGDVANDECAVDRFLKRLPENPELYRHLFTSHYPNDDRFRLDVLDKSSQLSDARGKKIKWKESASDWSKVAVEFWKDPSKGLDLFKAWISIDYVERFIVEKRDVKEGFDPNNTDKYDKQWKTLAHLLGDCKREDLLYHLLETHPALKDVKVRKPLVI
jgi:hypothetical protein